MHIRHTYQEFKCQDLSVEKWEEVVVSNDITGDVEIEDRFLEMQIMEEKSEEKYLGDVQYTDGKNVKNIKARIAKGKRIVNKILTALDGIPFSVDIISK